MKLRSAQILSGVYHSPRSQCIEWISSLTVHAPVCSQSVDPSSSIVIACSASCRGYQVIVVQLLLGSAICVLYHDVRYTIMQLEEDSWCSMYVKGV